MRIRVVCSQVGIHKACSFTRKSPVCLPFCGVTRITVKFIFSSEKDLGIYGMILDHYKHKSLRIPMASVILCVTSYSLYNLFIYIS